jgi:FtsH-binding integral membrane protein
MEKVYSGMWNVREICAAILWTSGKKRMKRYMRPIITIGLGFSLALFSAALTYTTPPAMQGTFGGATTFFMQSTSTPLPQDQDLSEIGSTDGIVLMGLLIALIVIIPILVRRESWMESR